MITFLSGLVIGYTLSQVLIISGALRRLHKLREANIKTAQVLYKK